jgi:hypothetical protein
VSSSRAVRIPKGRAPSTSAPDAPPRSESTVDRRKNQAALERAHRLTAIYVGSLIVLYVLFVGLDRTEPGGSSAAAQTGLLFFTLIAAAIGLVGAYVALSPAPRAVEVLPDAVVVIEWWGHRRAYPRLDELTISVVRRYPASFLSSRDIESVEFGTRARGRRTYQLEAGLLPVRPLRPLNVAT